MNDSKKTQKIKIVFMGSSEFAETILSALISAGYDVAGVFTQPDRKTGRSQEIKVTAVKIMAEKNSIPVFQPDNFDEKVFGDLRKINPDLIIVAAYGKILPEKALKIPRFGAINVHASLLPKFRGPSPIQNALLLGERETGTTIMLMDGGIDTGKILGQRKIEILPDDSYSELSRKLADASVDLMLEIIPKWTKKEIEAAAQDESQATLCQLIEKSDGRIIWSEEAKDIYNRYRAFVRWPGVFAFWERNGKNFRIKLNKISLHKFSPKAKYHPGEVFRLEDKIAVQTGLGTIILEEVQPEGKTGMKAEEFIRGYPEFIGTVLK